jgi:serine phosphatase RsbU (regulator of sigma subunit)
VALLVGLALTAALTVTSELSYEHNEDRLLSLQTKLTGLVLSTDVAQFETNLDRIAGVSSEARDPKATFVHVVSSVVGPKGLYASASLSIVENGRVRVLVHLGTPPFRDLKSPSVTSLLRKAAHTPSLLTSRVVKGRLQKLSYLVSAPAPGGVFVVAAAQQLPAGDLVSVPRSFPDANLDFALYFGPRTSQSALIETNSHRLPLTGTVAKSTVAFGNNVLALFASPRGSLAGSWSEAIPWVVLGGGVLISLAAATLMERILRQRALAESAATLNRQWYQRQRSVSEDLQRALLPKTLPVVDGVDLAARYIPGTRDIEVGGDWYSVVPVDRRRFTFVVGDVSGHDSTAAGIMGSVRFSVRALTQLGLGPVEVLERTDTDLDIGRDRHFATVLVGTVDMARQELTLASAGHLPPLLFGGEHAHFAPVPAGAPLGVHGQARQAVTVAFPPGSTLVAFTDGLVEKRGEDLEQGLHRLVKVASGQAGPAEALIDHIVGILTADGHEDDIAILAIHFLGPGPG